MLGPMSKRHVLLRWLSVALALTFIVVSPPARADTKAECAKAYETAQEQRGQGKLREARKNLVTCSQSACAAFIKKDCTKWLSEVESSLPSVVFSAKAAGADVTDVKVSLGDEVLTESLDGRAIEMDPGTHTFVFESAKHGKKEVDAIVKEGQKAQSIEAVFAGAKPAAATPTEDEGAADGVSTEDASGRKTIAYVLAGVGVVGLAGFAYFGLSGNSDKDALECADTKTCSDEELDPIKKKYLYADISLGVGLVSLGVATYLLVTKPGKEAPPASAKRLRFDATPTRGGGFAAISGRF